jgi:hypothetical protein
VNPVVATTTSAVLGNSDTKDETGTETMTVDGMVT